MVFRLGTIQVTLRASGAREGGEAEKNEEEKEEEQEQEEEEQQQQEEWNDQDEVEESEDSPRPAKQTDRSGWQKGTELKRLDLVSCWAH